MHAVEKSRGESATRTALLLCALPLGDDGGKPFEGSPVPPEIQLTKANRLSGLVKTPPTLVPDGLGIPSKLLPFRPARPLLLADGSKVTTRAAMF